MRKENEIGLKVYSTDNKLPLSNRMDSLENLVKVGFVVLLVIVATMLLDYWSLKNDLSQERYQLLKEQINSKCI
ncbi:hypothetical protein COU48_00355 [Candidatus Nomurabacteria bacterium CG10_big_fil_rev_8_21_14_0_10_03_31_7]|uniref:Uncharacterized protein n=1 Tax=Candidatus Nomurabacteria bacterium CG10_big_fil_rev_8_21_14_0_10_03_31_7 TaxID=1974730 RepID=A0A2J0JJ63_9BACT|nr:MAG: hypothetical protein COU48_00355 [Candidatus Nomurabacteria bacterium CG10_big_fil_rev_8_21_14_0_10_03_31_7]